MRFHLMFLLLGPALSVAGEVKRPRGVSPSNQQFYDETKPFTCFDGSKTIPLDRVNDDYCDCKDASDEPGTSACPNGHFHCGNTGFKASYISSSRVNDGICDCCDATDEYNSGTGCENTCRELGKKERGILLKMTEVAKEGLKVKQQLIEKASKIKEEKKKKLDELRELKSLIENKMKVLKTAKEKAELPENEAKEKHQQAWKELTRAKQEGARAVVAFNELDKNGDGFVSVVEIQAHSELDGDEDDIFSEMEAQVILGGSSKIDLEYFQDLVWRNIKNEYKTEDDVEAYSESWDELDNSNLEEDYHDEDEEVDNEDDSEVSVGKPSESKTDTNYENMPDYDEETQALIVAAEDARDQFITVESSLQDTKDAIRNLEKELSMDFGQNDEFAYMFGKCYEVTNEYVYRLCPFEKIIQKLKQGGSETNLGTWHSWAGPEGNKYSAMKYDGGRACWQGPNRSTTECHLLGVVKIEGNHLIL
ncbi:glucosidase 2 subunit beta-like isoform X2 [Heptranchias perlo]|uniref:glucosidase 2 subunit beta-like isoform X2 n=1 Tax=Heptranchias perlo TaxID=212740 RepID=UPI00355AB289